MIIKSLLNEINAAIERSSQLMRNRRKKTAFVLTACLSRDERVSVSGVSNIDDNDMFVHEERGGEFNREGSFVPFRLLL